MFHKMPFILASIIFSIILFDPIIPLLLKNILYSTSLTIKSVIALFLPFIIFGLLFKSAVILSKSASKIIGIILILVCCSNFFSTWMSHYIGILIYSFTLSLITPKEMTGLTALWSINFPILLANDRAMFSGMILGLTLSKLWPQQSLDISIKIEKFVRILSSGIVYLIPLFVSGFIVKMQHEGVMGLIIKDYTPVFTVVAIWQFSYIIIAYLVLNNFSVSALFNNIKNMLPATISAFSTMSSAVAMPLTMIGTELNLKNKEIAGAVIPATVNIHLVGDCFAIPLFAYAVLKSFGMDEPSLLNYLLFSFYFVLAKFSVAAIPGGGIIVMLPILEKYLGFNTEMMSLMTALYILFDPVITSANVLGNGGFAKMIDNLLGRLKIS
jgi:Na+/H+-dicarboxylate symporter